MDGNVTQPEDLQPYIDDALNELEFIAGPADSPWGSRRAELGHPKPFNLEYVEVGNEDWVAGYPTGYDTYRDYRFPRFNEAIKAAYPNITVLYSGATTDGYPDTHRWPSDVVGDYVSSHRNAWLDRKANELYSTHTASQMLWSGSSTASITKP